MMYDPMMVQPMRDELTRVGFKELKTAEDVDVHMSEKKGTSLVFINSICGCAAGIARPSLIASLEHPVRPQSLTTAFAGNDAEAVQRARDYFVGYAPSSPSMALFRDGDLVHMIERHQIEGQNVEALTRMITSAFDRFCGEMVDESVEIYDPLGELQISVDKAKERLSSNSDLALLDLRGPSEIRSGKIEGALEVSDQLGNEILSKWPKTREIIIYCQHGEQSLRAVQYLRQQGFQQVYSLKGGLSAWQ